MSFIRTQIIEKKNGAKPGLWKNAKKAVMAALNDQLHSHNCEAVEAGYLRRLPGITEGDREITEFEKSNTEQTDVQGKLAKMIPPGKTLEGMEMLFSWSDKLQKRTSTSTQKLTWTEIITFMAAFTRSCSCGERNEDLRDCELAFIFTEHFRTIGATGRTALMFVGRKGKTNRSGRIRTHGCLAHKNPLLCPVACIAFMMINRWSLGEQPPDFTDHTTLCGHYLFRSPTSPKQPMSYNMFHDLFEAFFSALGVAVAMVTHYGRHWAYRTCDEYQLDEDLISRLTNTASGTSSKTEAYCTGATPAVLMTLSGLDHNEGSHAAIPAHLDVPVPPELIFELVPFLRNKVESVDEAYLEAEAAAKDDTLKKHKVLMERRLYTARGTLDAILFMISVAIAVAAARPRDEFGRIIVTSQPMYLKFQQFPIFNTLSLSHTFLEFQKLVSQKEDAELGIVDDLGASTPIAKQLIQQLLAKVQSLQQSQEQLRAEQLQAREQSRAELHPLFHQQGQIITLLGGLQNVQHLSSGSDLTPSTSLVARYNAAPATVAFENSLNSATKHTISQRSGQQLSPLQLPLVHDINPKSSKRQRFVRENIVDTANGQVFITYLSQIKTAAHLWTLYTCSAGLGKPSFRILEDKFRNKWRNYPNGDRRWSELLRIVKYVEKQIADPNNWPGVTDVSLRECNAVQMLQDIMDTHRNPNSHCDSPNWKAVLKTIQEQHPLRKQQIQIAL